MKKTVCCVIVSAAVLLLLAGGIWYRWNGHYTDIDTALSPDGRCEVCLQMKGEPEWPFGATHGRILLRYDGKLVQTSVVTVQDDGAVMRPDNWSVAWGKSGVEITLKGSEQEDAVLSFRYDGSPFAGYTDAEITEEIAARYPGANPLGVEDGYYVFEADGCTFQVQNDLLMRDNYRMERFRCLTDAYFAGRNRAHEYEESGDGVGRTYVPVISLHSSQSEEKEWFCSDVVNWLLFCFAELPYAGNEEVYTSFVISYMGGLYPYEPEGLDLLTGENISGTYNPLYAYVEELLRDSYAQEVTDGDSDEVSRSMGQPTREQVEFYLTLEPECTWESADGTEYRMVAVDAALGSRYYVLIAVSDGECLFVNPDPYLGSGGVARWISFLSDDHTGFSCLSYSGGSYGQLYRTEDGGRSFSRVEYPSAMAKLPDGTSYNPFVMPERVYEEDGKLYLVAGQGADGDYYGEEGFCDGLYESADGGVTWSYVGEIAHASDEPG